jgi:membrane protein YqaA with SNARE-associated domain
MKAPPASKRGQSGAKLLGSAIFKEGPMSEIAQPRGLRAIYAWMLKNAQGRHAWAALALFAFAEASFFPIPPDVMLLPMMLANRRRAFVLGAWCAFWSVIGGMLGYAIGAFLYESLGQWLIRVYHLGQDMTQFQSWYETYGAWIIVIKGFTPIPYKLVTISAGLAGVPFAAFMGYSAITRAARFVLLEGVLVTLFGEQAQRILEKYLELALIAFLVLVVLGFVLLHYVLK